MEFILVFLLTVKMPDGSVRQNVPVSAGKPTDIDTCQAQVRIHQRMSKVPAECKKVEGFRPVPTEGASK